MADTTTSAAAPTTPPPPAPVETALGSAAPASPPSNTSQGTQGDNGNATGESTVAAPPAKPDEGEATPAEGAKTEEPAAAADFDIKLPEGVVADAETLTNFKALAKEAGLKGEHAQKITDLYIGMVQKQAEADAAAADAETRAWGEALKTDKEFGGPAWDANKATAQRALDKFGSPELGALLTQSGLGNHPEVVRAFYRIGKALKEDSIAGTGGGGRATPANSDEAFLRGQYPTMFQP